MNERRRLWRRWWVEITLLIVLLVPVAVLLTSGTLWLWERGWLLWWLLATAAASAAAWGAARLRRGRSRPIDAEEAPAALTEPDPSWAPHERAAWDAVCRLSVEADSAMLDDRRLLLAAARQTVEAVAQHYHPSRREPALEFTLPELLLLSERVSARLRVLLLEHVPFSHRLKARHVLRAWDYRPLVQTGLRHGQKAYVLWRIARAVNPINALVAELRDHLMDDLFSDLHAQVRRKIVRLWIEEVGRAAIELYSGRLKVDAARLAAAAEAEKLEGVAEPAAAPGALRLLVAGQTNAGKSTLVNGMLGELSAGVDVLPLTAGFEGYELRQQGLPPAYVIDTPGVEDDAGVIELVKRAFASDLIVWVTAAHRADRALDRRALDALRARFAAEPGRKMPPLLVVASHVDRLSPAREWSPPYNVEAPESAKERAIRDALDAIAADLPVPIDTIVPMRLDTQPPYNLDLLWARLASVLEEAQLARWVRVMRTAGGRADWRQAWRQLVGAGRMVGSLVKR